MIKKMITKNFRRVSWKILVFLFFIPVDSILGCTSILISGKLTPDGKPLLLKHRDAVNDHSFIARIKGEKYDIMALVDSNYLRLKNVYCGMNNANFSIVNTGTFNLGNRKIKGIDPTRIMYTALSKCKNLGEFENLLSALQQTDSLIPANFGVIDAYGGASYYEVGYKKWVKFDVHDEAIAPDGYLIYTNFSLSGSPSNRRGYIRYMTSDVIMGEGLQKGVHFTAKWIVDHISRSFRNEFLGVNLTDSRFLPNGIFIDQDFIPNRYSCSSIVFQGISKGSKTQTTMWTVLGYPLTSVIIPLGMDYSVPSCLLDNDTGVAELCKLSLSCKKKVYLTPYDKDKYYLDYSLLYNQEEDGITQQLMRIERNMLEKYNRIVNGKEYFSTNRRIIELFDRYYEKIKKVIAKTL